MKEESSRFIRLRGLPWSVAHQEIVDFLSDVKIVNNTKGIHLITNRWDGKNTGEAFVELESELDEERAFAHNKETLGHRYIEIFSASVEEAHHAIRRPNQPSNVVKLRGLPYSVTEEVVENFFDGLEIKPDREGILIIMDKRGRPTGEAYVQFETQDDTERALKRNREKIGHRYIEIFRSSVAELKRQTSNYRPGPYDKKDRGGSRGGGDGGNDYSRNNSRNTRPREVWASNNNSFGSGNFGSGKFDGNNSGGGGGSGGNSFNNSGSRNMGGSGGFNNGGGTSGFGGFGNMGPGFGNNNNNSRENNGFGNNNGPGFGSGGFGNSSGGGGGGPLGSSSGGFGDFNNFGNSRGNFNGNSNFNDGPFQSMPNRNNNNMGNNQGGFGNGFFGNNNGMSDTGRGGGGGMMGRGNNNTNFGGGNFGPIGGGRLDTDKLFCIHLRGLPYYSFEDDVKSFFDPLIPLNINIIMNNKGLHSGSADAYFATHEEAVQAMKKNREKMGSRYIELFYDGKSKKDNFRRL